MEKLKKYQRDPKVKALLDEYDALQKDTPIQAEAEENTYDGLSLDDLA
ncbi:hypothetical protein MKC85_22920 [[Clostridium] innocuum]|nr:hypothetical protein [[Clostridium] innocuum]